MDDIGIIHSAANRFCYQHLISGIGREIEPSFNGDIRRVKGDDILNSDDTVRISPSA